MINYRGIKYDLIVSLNKHLYLCDLMAKCHTTIQPVLFPSTALLIRLLTFSWYLAFPQIILRK